MSSFQLTSRLLCHLLTALWRSVHLTMDSLRAATMFVSSPGRTHDGPWQAHHAEELVDRFPLSGYLLAEPRALPGFSLSLSMRSCWIYVMRHCGNKAFPIVLHPHPRASRLISTCRASVLLHTLYDQPTPSPTASSRPPYGRYLCLQLPRPLPSRDWTYAAELPKLFP